MIMISSVLYNGLFFVFQLLSMRLAAVNPRVDFNMDSIFAADVRIIFLYFIPHSLKREREMSRCFLVLGDARDLAETFCNLVIVQCSFLHLKFF